MTDVSGTAYRSRVNYPFSAICGQERLKLALIINVVNPQIGGALIRGERGCGKTIAVRGLADLLPEIDVVEGCRFSCVPPTSARCARSAVNRMKEGRRSRWRADG